MKEFRFDQSFARDDGGKYVRLPFEMPGGIERIEVDYEYSRFVEEKFSDGTIRREANIIDLGIYDEKGNLFGWSGSNRSSFFITSTTATPGYHHGELRAGTWAVALGLYKIENTVQIKVCVRMYESERRLYRGDLHIHTLNSDGAYTSAFVMESAEKAGLDFIALTDHNNTKQNSEIGNPQRLSVIPGVEYTNYLGHGNFFFPSWDKPFNDDFLSNSFDEMAGVFRRAKAAGALISLNHPFSDCPWAFGYENFPFDMIEVWNGPMSSFNMTAVELWHSFLCSGKKIPAVAGSDMHIHSLGSTCGSPCTMVWADSPAPSDLLAALAAGRVSLSFSPQGPCLDLEIAGAGVGETAVFRSGLEGKALVSGARKGDVIKVINQDGLAASFTAPFSGLYAPSFQVKDRGFYRLELYRPLLDQPALCALSNPVFTG